MNKAEREKFHKKIVRHYRKSKNAAETAEHFSVAVQTVRDVCKRAGVIFRHGKTEKLEVGEKYVSKIRIAAKGAGLI